MPELERCGFQTLQEKMVQGSGASVRGLSADGSTWVECSMPRPEFRDSLRQLFKMGELRGAPCTAQFTTEFNNRSYLITTSADLACAAGIAVERLPPGTPIATMALRHMQRIEAALLDGHPLKLLTHTCAAEVEAAQARLRARRLQPAAAPSAITVKSLGKLGVPLRWALLIAGDHAETADALRR